MSHAPWHISHQIYIYRYLYMLRAIYYGCFASLVYLSLMTCWRVLSADSYMCTYVHTHCSMAVYYNTSSPPCTVFPEVDIIAESTVVNETNDAVFTCVSTGIPEPSIMWFVYPSFFMSSGGGGSMTVDSDGMENLISCTTRVLDSQNIEVTSTLTVHRTHMNNSGIYTCEAMNSLSAVRDTAELIVQCKCSSLWQPN